MNIKLFLVAGAALMLSACGATQQEQNMDISNVSNKLPEGCTLQYLGSVRTEGSSRPAKIFAVKCGETTTLSATYTVKSGKNTHSETDVSVTIDN